MNSFRVRLIGSVVLAVLNLTVWGVSSATRASELPAAPADQGNLPASANQETERQKPPRITSEIDDSVLTRIPRTTHPLATAANDRGRVDGALPMNRIVLLLKPSQQQQIELKKLLATQNDPESPNYQSWLEPEQFAERFGPSQADIDKITAWLGQHDFTVNSIARGGQWIEFSGSADQVEGAFHTEIHNYVVNGEAHVANAMDISLPQALTPVVTGVLSLHDFKPKSLLSQVAHTHRDPGTGKLMPVRASLGERINGSVADEFTQPGILNPSHFLTPGDWSKIYNTAPLLDQKVTGAGISIAIVGSDTDLELSDIRTFRQMFHLPAKDPVFYINGIDPGLLYLSPAEVEGELDVEWSGAAAPDATIRFVTSASTASTFGGLLSISYIVDNRLAPIMSASVGECEAFLGAAGNAFLYSAYQQAAAEGITVVVASGDVGAAGCDPQEGGPAINGQNVSGFASTPYNLAVGGTMFDENGLDGNYWLANNRADFSSAIGYIPEAVWNESCDPTVDPNGCGDGFYHLSASSGGPSNCVQSTVAGQIITCVTGYTKPSWQFGGGVPADGARDVPDVALASAGGHDAFLMCIEGSCQTATANGETVIEDASTVGGTSAAAPTMAGLIALVEQKTGAYQGLINYDLYKLSAAEKLTACNSSDQLNPKSSNECDFYDTTVGNSNVPGQVGFEAGVGYDMATGLGSINAENLLNNWHTIPKVPTTTKLLSSTNPVIAVHGQAIPMLVAVKPTSGSGAPDGDFSLLSDAGSILGGTVVNGSFAGKISSLPGGQHNVRARYAGDPTFAPSDSGSLTVNISPEQSVVNVQPVVVSQTFGEAVPSSTTQIAYGDGLYLQVNVHGKSGIGAPTGDLMIQLDDKAPFGPFSLNQSGTALVEVDGLNISGYNDTGNTGLSRLASTGILPGNHTFRVIYGGDASFKSAKAAPTTLTVNKDSSQSGVIPVQSVFTSGVPIDFVFQQIPFFADLGFKGLEQPTGSVQLYDCGSDPSACANPVAIGGPIRLTTTSNPLEGSPGTPVAQATYRGVFSAGVHALRLTYSGDSNYIPEGLNAFGKLSTVITVSTASGLEPKIQLTQVTGTIVVGESASYIVSVKAPHPGNPMPTGSVSLMDQFSNNFGTVPLSGGNASFVVPFFFAGPELIYVSYSGDANYSSLNSVTLATTTIKPAEPTIMVSAGPGIVKEGSRTVLAATVIGAPLNPNINSPFAENGQVEFFDVVDGKDAMVLGGGPVYLTLANGGNSIAMLQVELPKGKNVITAKFLGTPEWLPRTSSPVAIDVH